MTDEAAWNDSPQAPAPGTSLGPLSGIAACSHVWLPLTFRSPRLLSEDCERLTCSNHLAQFAVDDGRALFGPVEPGCGLIRVPVHVDARGELVIGDDA